MTKQLATLRHRKQLWETELADLEARYKKKEIIRASYRRMKKTIKGFILDIENRIKELE